MLRKFGLFLLVKNSISGCSKEEPPKDGIITFIGHHLKGGCFYAAGFHKTGFTKSRRLLTLQLAPDRMPPPVEPAEEGISVAQHTKEEYLQLRTEGKNRAQIAAEWERG